jgi:hypothetical protein
MLMKRNRIIVFLFSIVAFTAFTARLSIAQEPATNIAGNWIIYANNIDRPGSSVKTIQVTQNGNIVLGKFRGPHQHGKLQGWINGNHIEFSTDTRDVLTFRGEITPQGMTGLYGIHGRHAPWNAERNNQ